MKRSTSVILGIPIDTLTLEEALVRIFQLAEAHRADGVPRLVCSLSMDSVIRTMGWGLRDVRHPELLSIIRAADLVTTDAAPVMRASGYLGPALKEAISGKDLVTRLVHEASLRGKSVYILGRKPGAAEKSADDLRRGCPGLIVAGCDSHLVHVDGEHLADAPEADGVIVDRINRTSPDLLLITWGSSSQELFFERNRHRLKVPVTLGIGAAAGPVPRVLERILDGRLDRVSRLVQVGGETLKRRLHDPARFWPQVWPSIVQYQLTRHTAPHHFLRKCKSKVSYKYMTRGRDQVLLLTLPGIVAAESVARLATLIPGRPSTHLVLDVSDVGFIDSAGLGLLLDVVNLWGRSGHEVLAIGVTPYAEKVLVVNRLYDLLAHRICPTLDDAFGYLDAHAGKDKCSMSIVEQDSSSTLAFAGDLKPSAISPGEIRVLASRVKGPRCTMDLSGLKSINTLGIILLLRVRRALESLGKECVLQGASGEVARMLKVTGTDRLL